MPRTHLVAREDGRADVSAEVDRELARGDSGPTYVFAVIRHRILLIGVITLCMWTGARVKRPVKRGCQ